MIIKAYYQANCFSEQFHAHHFGCGMEKEILNDLPDGDIHSEYILLQDLCKVAVESEIMAFKEEYAARAEKQRELDASA